MVAAPGSHSSARAGSCSRTLNRSPRCWRLDEAALYHRAEDRGFFTLLWAEPDAAPGHRPPVLKSSGPTALMFSPDHRRPRPGTGHLDFPGRVSPAQPPDRPPAASGAVFRRSGYLQDPHGESRPETLLGRFLGHYWGRGCALALAGDLQRARFAGEMAAGTPLPRAALPRWNAVQRELVARLEPFGADPGARDASQVLRLVDTVNTRSGERVRVLWVQRHAEDVRRYPFEWLAETLLPVSREALQLKRQPHSTAHPLKVLPGGKTGNLRVFSGRQLAWDRLEPTQARPTARLDRTRHPARLPLQVRPLVPRFLLLSGAIPANQLYLEAQAWFGSLSRLRQGRALRALHPVPQSQSLRSRRTDPNSTAAPTTALHPAIAPCSPCLTCKTMK